jgi:hypothetical protein
MLSTGDSHIYSHVRNFDDSSMKLGLPVENVKDQGRLSDYRKLLLNGLGSDEEESRWWMGGCCW